MVDAPKLGLESDSDPSAHDKVGTHAVREMCGERLGTGKQIAFLRFFVKLKLRTMTERRHRQIQHTSEWREATALILASEKGFVVADEAAEEEQELP